MACDIILLSRWQTRKPYRFDRGLPPILRGLTTRYAINHMLLTYRYRIYPTQEQEAWLFRVLEHLRELHNSARLNRIRAYEEEGRFVSYQEQTKILTEARKRHSDFKEIPQDFQNHALRRVDKAFANFRRRLKQGSNTPGFPRHRRRIRSLTFSLRKYKDKHGNRVRENPIVETGTRLDRLKVPKLGEVKIRMSRSLTGDPKEVDIVKKASGWYAHISCDIGDTPKVEPTDAIAIDVGTTHYLTTSEGEQIYNPRWYRQAEGLLQKHSKDLSRKKKGSHRWQKQHYELALHHERTANKRKDFIGKLVYKLFHHYKNNVLISEDLQVSNMVKNHHLSKSISDVSWSMFFDWCASIAARDGLHYHKVNPRNTSQICSSCGVKSPKKLSLAVRTFKCDSCGKSIDRDHNAALNILYRAAEALLGERWVTNL